MMNQNSHEVEHRHLISLHTTVNGRLVEARIEPRETLLAFLRDRLKLKGAKHSCDVQVCGSCTVLLAGKPVSACTTLAYEAQGREVLTIEGVAQDGLLHPLQTAFIHKAAVQCGFCTPGMILTALSLLQEYERPTRAQIQDYMRGNLCRCTGYRNILEAIEEVFDLSTSTEKEELEGSKS